MNIRIRYYVYLLLLLQITVSCSKEQEIIPEAKANSVRFTSQSVSTRGNIIGTNTINAMSVFAYYTGNDSWTNANTTSSLQNFMNNQSVNRTKGTTEVWGSWNYSPIKYWPKDPNDNITFFAFSPDNAIQSSYKFMGKKPVFSYQVNGKASQHQDLLWTFPTVESGLDMSVGNGGTLPKVAFNFKHALTRISLSANVSSQKLADEGYSILGVTFKNLASLGSVNYNIDSITGSHTGAQWTLADNRDTDISASAGTSLIDTTNDLTTELQMITKNDVYFFMLPQLIESTTVATKPSIALRLYDRTNNIIRVIKADLVSPNREGWKAGKWINLAVTYSGGGDTPMTISPTVLGWDDQDVPIEFPVTYLNTDKSSYTTTINKPVYIYYETDYMGRVSAVNKLGTSLPDFGEYFMYGKSSTAGSDEVTITAANINRTVTITIVK